MCIEINTMSDNTTTFDLNIPNEVTAEYEQNFKTKQAASKVQQPPKTPIIELSNGSFQLDFAFRTSGHKL